MSGTSPDVAVAPRIAGWLLLPLAWLVLTWLSSTLALANYMTALMHPALREALFALQERFAWQFLLSLLIALAMWLYTGWVTWLFCLRRRTLPRHYIVWLLVSVLLALRSFAFSPVADGAAVQNLLLVLAAAAVLAPYFRRSQRVKATFLRD
ncbi:DUF2569 domain-containing protein [Pantoea sp. 1.19]|uniref:DUF2569 domain-containing protein n=1 Tax=Pantoea sp. 1.19 TaxID=1925589 RepID=UPI0009491994|nr:DUF2569 domain-containing protein [Pantoea sp. 1.19]